MFLDLKDLVFTLVLQNFLHGSLYVYYNNMFFTFLYKNLTDLTSPVLAVQHIRPTRYVLNSPLMCLHMHIST